MRAIIPAIIAALWMTAVFYFSWSMQANSIAATNAANTASCAASKSTLSALQLVPYQLRAADVLTVAPTLRALYNINVDFFETDGRVTNRFSMIQVCRRYLPRHPGIPNALAGMHAGRCCFPHSHHYNVVCARLVLWLARTRRQRFTARRTGWGTP